MTAQDLPQIYADAIPPQVDSRVVAKQLRGDITFLERTDSGTLSWLICWFNSLGFDRGSWMGRLPQVSPLGRH